MEQSLKQNLENRLVMSQMLQQAISLLQLTNQELIQKVEQELTENPLLEESPVVSQNISMEENDKKNETQKNDEEYLIWKEHLDDDYKDFNKYDNSNKDKNTIQDLTSNKESLFDHLIWQLNMSKLSYHEVKIGEYIIGNINQNGYFIGDIKEVSQILKVNYKEVEKILKTIQRFDPIGIAARNLNECLFIQAKELYPEDKILSEIIESYFVDLAEMKFAKISEKINIDISIVQKCFDVLRTFEPKPGRQYSSEQNKIITPDVIIEKEEDGKYIVKVNDNYLPKLHINQYYKNILKKSDSPDVKKYLKEKLDSASWLLSSIEQRKNTLFRVTTQIVEHQKDFFDKGVLFLKPLSLSDVASVVSMHESTISRVTTNKYAQTPLGMFELKYFFIRGMENDFGEDISTAKIKDKITNIVENENKAKPVSDQKIVELLKQEGLNIARRTVAKYREELNIHSSAKRKKV